MNRTLSSKARCLCSENVASIEAYFVDKKKCQDAGAAGGRQITPALLNEAFLGKSAKFKMVPVLR